MHLAQRCCHCWKHFWNYWCGRVFSAFVSFFRCLTSPETFVPLRQTLFSETTRSHSEPNQGNRMGLPLQYSTFEPETAWQRAPCELEHFYAGESNCWAKL